MRQIQKIRRSLIVCSALFSMSFTAHCFGQDDKNAGALAKFNVKTDEGLTSVTGIYLKTENGIIHVFDLNTFSEFEIESNNVTLKKIPISEDEAAERVGIAPIIAWRLKDLIPQAPKPGRVAAVDAAVSYLNLGTDAGIRVGDELQVYRGETEINDPVTGDVIGKIRRKVAVVEVLEVRDKLSKVKIVGDLELQLQVGDAVESDRQSHAIAVLPASNANGVTLKSGIALADEIASGLSKFKVSMIERTKLIDVLGELALQRTGLFDNKTVQKLGHQVGAYAVLSGTIIPSGKNSKISVRLIEVETGKVLYASAIEVRDYDDTIADLKTARTITAEPSEKNTVDLRSRWINTTYKTTVSQVEDKEWREIPATGQFKHQYKETARTSEYIELYCPKRKIEVRLLSNRMEQKINGKWSHVAAGRWDSP